MGPRRPRARQIAVDLTPLRSSVPYRALWSGQLVSLIGTNMRVVAVAYQVFELTGSSVAVGMIGLFEVIPLIVMSTWGGAIADRMDKRALLVRTQWALVLVSAALAAVTVYGPPSVWLIYALTGLAAGITGVDQPTRSALAPSFVAPEHVSAIMALRQVNFQITQIVGPALGGLAIVAIGVEGVYAIDAVSFFAALVALRWVPSRPVQPGEKTTLESIREGLRFAFRTPILRGIFVIDLVAMIFGMPRAVFPALADHTFDISAAGLGLLYAAPSAGALAGALASGWVRAIPRQGLAVVLAVAGWGAAIAAAGLAAFAGALLPTLLFLAVAGWADVLSAVFRGTILLDATPDPLRGRVIAVQIMVVTGGPRLGDVEAGLVAGAFGAPASVLIGGLACLIGTAALAATSSALREHRAAPGVGVAVEAPVEHA